MTVQTGIGWHFSASHRDPVRQEVHGHSYEVVVWVHGFPPRDAVALQTRLQGILRAWDHKTLPDSISCAEDLAPEIARMWGDDCIEVVISRASERLHARWRP